MLFTIAFIFFLGGLWWRSVEWKKIVERQEQMADNVRGGWQAAASLYADLSNDRRLPPLDPTPVVLRENEVIQVRTAARYTRFVSAGDGSYTHMVGFGTGWAGALLAGSAMVGNSRRRNAATAAAAPAWREQQQIEFLAGNYGLIAFPNGQVMHFDWQAVSAFHPAPEHLSVTFEFYSAAPLTISGPYAPLLCVYAAFHLWGRERFCSAPTLHALRSAPVSAMPLPR
ncbi:hypothetical protein [Tomitella gaofuii]|uniref:hypothetical protein n=1 Tax=Tomitella gaofuii TaxID=2760083 RepID=UPI0015F7B1AF|nr:hypothetical protein [Tomitella gaofuii]